MPPAPTINICTYWYMSAIYTYMYLSYICIRVKAKITERRKCPAKVADQQAWQEKNMIDDGRWWHIMWYVMWHVSAKCLALNRLWPRALRKRWARLARSRHATKRCYTHMLCVNAHMLCVKAHMLCVNLLKCLPRLAHISRPTLELSFHLHSLFTFIFSLFTGALCVLTWGACAIR